ncbi:hypothetical protein BN2475_430001 [Paraburkholderia ribeironis]|uniref:Uncharacterized protein n=1 Tax=Paraburkholderia ribeironis TaxID=1247936 RepID=A0A1N7S814_9BURK|nr:hypothetical protein BN2475_430001 [Paraburkholderia ribeironis]
MSQEPLVAGRSRGSRQKDRFTWLELHLSNETHRNLNASGLVDRTNHPLILEDSLCRLAVGTLLFSALPCLSMGRSIADRHVAVLSKPGLTTLLPV